MFLSVKALCWLTVFMCCGYTVSDRCSCGDVKDLSGENLQKLIETDHLYVNFALLYKLANTKSCVVGRYVIVEMSWLYNVNEHK